MTVAQKMTLPILTEESGASVPSNVRIDAPDKHEFNDATALPPRTDQKPENSAIIDGD